MASVSQTLWSYGRNAALGAAEYMTPVLTESHFTTKGVITPDEFVAAGDLLVLRCPSWMWQARAVSPICGARRHSVFSHMSADEFFLRNKEPVLPYVAPAVSLCFPIWQAGDPSKARAFLPPGKQFLVTRSVPCQRRASALGAGADDEQILHFGSAAAADSGGGGDDDDDEWVATHTTRRVQADEEVPDMKTLSLDPPPATQPKDDTAKGSTSTETDGATERAQAAAAAAAAAAKLSALEASMEDAELVDFEDPSEHVPLPDADDNIVRARSYDLSITYDKYYQCARVWLSGYSETRQPLTQAETLEDVSADHAMKTVTLESHPHVGSGAGLHASLHPCKHAQVMHKLCSEMLAGGRECRTDQYLFLFLKFISSVIPTIEYDYTLEVC